MTATQAASGWLLCDLSTNRSVSAGSDGTATWYSAAEKGSVLVFSGQTQCHAGQVVAAKQQTKAGPGYSSEATVGRTGVAS